MPRKKQTKQEDDGLQGGDAIKKDADGWYLVRRVDGKDIVHYAEKHSVFDGPDGQQIAIGISRIGNCGLAYHDGLIDEALIEPSDLLACENYFNRYREAPEMDVPQMLLAAERVIEELEKQLDAAARSRPGRPRKHGTMRRDALIVSLREKQKFSLKEIHKFFRRRGDTLSIGGIRAGYKAGKKDQLMNRGLSSNAEKTS